ncbi:MAG TPA: hypothetical protein DDW55_08265 [Gammaproteobacteria bacterium]|nr:hypothetical protein [Gammaproteobacteria bacterium]
MYFRAMTDELQGMGLSDTLISQESGNGTQLVAQLEDQRRQLDELSESDELGRQRLQLSIAETLVALEKKEEAWQLARQVFDYMVSEQQWQDAVEACDVMYAADQPDSIAALGNGIWLAVTFPVDPQLSTNLLDHVIDETPKDSDGAAVAAATAHYLVELRAKDEAQRTSLGFLTGNMLAGVANRHSDLKEKDQIDFWVERLELDQPDKFLPRLATMLDVIIGDKWWIDRDAIRANLPE